MNLGAERLLQYTNLGVNQEVSLPAFREGIILPARLISIDAVRTNMQNSSGHTPLLFTTEEIAHSLRYKVRPHEHFAARLAAKQIVLGLLNSEALGWQDASVRNNDYNSPSFVFSNMTQDLLNSRGIEAVHLSLSHEDDTAIAFCAIERDDDVQSAGIIRIGADLCSPKPFQSLRIPRTNTFNEEEIEVARQQEFPAERFAMYYAAKESVVKILETLSGWIWMEIGIHEEESAFRISLSGSARERLEQMGAAEIVTVLYFREGVGALAFSAAVASPLDRIRA